MHLLILSYSAENGACAAARAVAEKWQLQGDTCDVVDTMHLLGKVSQSIASGPFSSAMKNHTSSPGSAGNRTCNEPADLTANSTYAHKVSTYLDDKRFDAVLCTHPLPMRILTGLRRQLRLAQPCFGVLTEYTHAPVWEETALDLYFSPHETVTRECIARGMEASRLRTTGMPVHSSFSEEQPKAQARNYLVMPQKRNIYLLSTRGMSAQRVSELCRLILEIDCQSELYVLTERDDPIREMIRSAFGPHVHSVVYTEKIHIYMRAADVLIVRPEAVASTEAASAGIPIVHLVPTLEAGQRNALFFSENGMAEIAATSAQAVRYAVELVKSSTKALKMRLAQKNTLKQQAAAEIAQQIKAFTATEVQPGFCCGFPG